MSVLFVVRSLGCRDNTTAVLCKRHIIWQSHRVEELFIRNCSFQIKGTCTIYTVAIINVIHMKEILCVRWQKTKGTTSCRTKMRPRDFMRNTNPKKSLEGLSRDISARKKKEYSVLFLFVQRVRVCDRYARVYIIRSWVHCDHNKRIEEFRAHGLHNKLTCTII